MCPVNQSGIVLDLPSLTFTIPEEPECRVLRDNLVSWVKAGFGPDKKAILLTGPAGVGKSILLAQFVEANKTTALSFFVGPDLWGSDPKRFLADLASQLHAVLGIEQAGLDRLGYDQLKARFSDLWAQFSNHARRGETPYFLVVDGLDQADRASAGESILELIPRRYGRNVYLLTSSPVDVSGRLAPLKLHAIEVPYFARAETQVMLDGLGLDATGAEQVQAASGGLPAFVAEVRRRLQSRLPLDRVLSDLSGGLDQLYAVEWDGSVLGNDAVQSLLAVQVCAPVPLARDTIARVAGIALDEVRSLLASLPFLKTTADGSISFATEGHRNFARSRLSGRFDWAQQALVKYYEQAGGPEAVAVLPVLYAAVNDIHSIRRMMSPTAMANHLGPDADYSKLRDSFILSTRVAQDKQDPAALVYFMVASSVLGTIRWRFRDLEGQIRALVALGDLDEAFVLAQQPLSPEDRLKGTAFVASSLIDGGRVLPPDIADLIDGLSEQVPVGRSPQEAAQLAATFFQVRPAAAVALIQRCTKGSARAVDQAMALLALAAQSTTEIDPGSYISDDRLREWVQSHQGPGSRDADAVVRQAESMSDLGGRLVYVSNWCNKNRSNPEAIAVINRAMDWMTEDSTYLPSLRVLRQICEPLEAVDPFQAKPLVERLEWLLRGMERAPMREYIRLQLLMAQQEFKWSVNDSDDRIMNTILDLSSVDELDTRAYGYARTLLALARVDPGDTRTGLRQDALNGLKESFQRLLADSADHYDLTSRIIRATTQYDPDLGATLARGLNTRYRRNQAFYDVLTTYASSAAVVDVELVLHWMAEFDDLDRYGGPALAQSLDLIVDRGHSIGAPEVGKVKAIVAGLPDPGDRAICYANLLVLASAPDEAGLLFAITEDNLALLDDPWRKATYGYRCVEILAKTQPDRARSLFASAEPGPSEPTSCNRFFGALYTHAVALAADGLAVDQEADTAALATQYLDAVSRVPSRSVQVSLLTRAGLRFGAAGLKEMELDFAARVVAMLDEIKDGHAAITAAISAAPLLLDRDEEELLEILGRLPGPARSAAIRTACDYLITSLPTDVPVDVNRVDRRLDYEQVKRLLTLIRAADDDWLIGNAARALVRGIVRTRTNPSMTQRQLLALAVKLREVAAEKLPDVQNIKHDGYAVLLEALALELEASAGQKGFKPDWDALSKKIAAVPNAADRVYLSEIIGADIAALDERAARRFIGLAEREIGAIPDQLDRAGRTLSLAEAYAAVGDEVSEKGLLQTAFSNAVAVARHLFGRSATRSNSGTCRSREPWIRRKPHGFGG